MGGRARAGIIRCRPCWRWPPGRWWPGCARSPRSPAAPAGVVAELYQRCGAARPAAAPPSKSTIWRVVTGADAPALDAVTEGQYPAVARGRGLTATDTGRRPTATSRTQFDPASGSRTRGRAEHRYLGPSGGAFTRVVEVPVPTPRQPVDSAVPEDTSTGAVPL